MIKQEQYDVWRKWALYLTKDINRADDLLHRVIESCIEKNLEESKWNNHYICQSISNEFKTDKKKEKSKKHQTVKTYDYIPEYKNSTEDEKYWEDPETNNKLAFLKKFIIKLPYPDQKLIHLHFFDGLSQRAIGREQGLSHIFINQKINKIKKTLLDEYNKENNKQ